jgi:SAM-dependent methyltransferase
MSRADRDRWDSRHASAAERAVPPSVTLRWLPPPAAPNALALDLACGTGRHARALLDGGYRVVAADLSFVGLTKLHESLAPALAAKRLQLVQLDVEAWPFVDASFDVVVQIDFLDRNALAVIRRTVKPGGLFLIDTFAGLPMVGRPGPQRAEWRLAHGELAERFADWEILRVEDAPSHERAAILARRPVCA